MSAHYPARATPPEPRRDPIQRAFEEYGITEWIPEKTTIEWSREGISLDVYAVGHDGDLLLDQDANGTAFDVVTVRRFYPHPKETR